MKSIKAAGTTGAMSPLPYSAMTVNGFLWATYGALLGEATILLPNVPGFFLGAYYLKTFNDHKADGVHMMPHFLGTAALIAGVSSSAAFLPVDTAISIIGTTGVIVVITMFGGPLAAIRDVIKSKSTAALPFAYTIATVANCSAWTGYGSFVIHDPMVWFPNAMGLGAGCVQLLLFARYGFHKPGTAE